MPGVYDYTDYLLTIMIGLERTDNVHTVTSESSSFLSHTTLSLAFHMIKSVYSPHCQGVLGSSGTPGRPGNGSGTGWRKSKKIPALSKIRKILHNTIHSTYLHIDQNIFAITQALLPLASESTDGGKIKAAQALAKIAITSNPEIAFPGERVRQRCIILTPVFS